MSMTGVAKRVIVLTSATVLATATIVVATDIATVTVATRMISVLKVRIVRSIWGIPSLTAASAPPLSITDGWPGMLTRG